MSIRIGVAPDSEDNDRSGFRLIDATTIGHGRMFGLFSNSKSKTGSSREHPDFDGAFPGSTANDPTLIGVVQDCEARVTPYDPDYGLFFDVVRSYGLTLRAAELTSRSLSKFDTLLVGSPANRISLLKRRALRNWMRAGGSLLFLGSFHGDCSQQGFKRLTGFDIGMTMLGIVAMPDDPESFQRGDTVDSRLPVDVSSLLGEKSTIIYDTGNTGIMRYGSADDRAELFSQNASLRLSIPPQAGAMELHLADDGRILSVDRMAEEDGVDVIPEGSDLNVRRYLEITHKHRNYLFTRIQIGVGRMLYFGAARSFMNYSLAQSDNAKFLNWLMPRWVRGLTHRELQRRQQSPQRHRLLHGYPMAPMMERIDRGREQRENRDLAGLGEREGSVVEAVQRQVKQCLQPNRNLIVGVLPHPFCNPKVKGCGFCTFPNQPFQRKAAERVVDSVIQEIEHTTKLLFEEKRHASDPAAKPKALYFGGGTANITPVPAFTRLCRSLSDTFDLSEAEVTLEGVPIYFRTGDYAIIDAMQQEIAARHFRISMGVQTFDADMIQRMGRDAFGSSGDIAQIIAVAQERKMCVSGDFLFNLPGQSLDQMLSDVDRAIDLGFDQICLYHLVLFEGLGTEWSKESGTLNDIPSNKEACHNWLILQQRMLDKGYVQSTLTNFERAGTSGTERRFQYEELAFAIDQHDAIGFGPNGISGFIDFENRRGVKMLNHERANDYENTVARSGHGWSRSFRYSERDLKVLFLTRQIARLRIESDRYEAVFGTHPTDDFPEEFDATLRACLLSLSDDDYHVTPTGMFYADSIAGLFAWQQVNARRAIEMAKADGSPDNVVFDVRINDAGFYPMG